MSYKQVIVMRKDLNMRKGKMVAQGSHASVTAVLKCFEKHAVSNSAELQMYRKWEENGTAKICVSVDSEEELRKVFNEAEDAGLICSFIVDSGRTEFNWVMTPTAVAIGPGPSEEIDKITGSLKLL